LIAERFAALLWKGIFAIFLIIALQWIILLEIVDFWLLLDLVGKTTVIPPSIVPTHISNQIQQEPKKVIVPQLPC
jgi:hypothetical protein